MNSSTRTLAAIACTVALALTAPAKADQLNVTSVSVPLYSSGINVSYGATTWSGVIAGQIVLHATNSATPAAPAFDAAAWCVDLFHAIYIGNNTYTYSIGSALTTDGNGGTISAATNAKIMTLGAYGNSLLAGANAGSADVSSAIQLAIWQTEYSGLTFVANAAVTAYVTTFEAYANTHTYTGTALAPLNGQQQLITDSVGPSGISGGNANAPEPVSIGLLATGLVGLGFVRRRRPQ
ncbi:MAG: PEP-CTERM sorting domain-containing protein [Rhodospirillales bacterium]